MAEASATPTSQVAAFLRLPVSELEKLSKHECWWCDHQSWLAEQGYMLRPRYRPGWTPLWHTKLDLIEFNHEDWHRPGVEAFVLDAVRVEDDSQVMLKQLKRMKYYFIDFGLSRRYDPMDGPPREHPIRGGDKSVPEFQPGVWKGELLDPFPTDIYYLGNLIRMDIMKAYRGIEFLVPLVKDMVQDDSAKRPTIQDVVRHFDELVRPLKSRQLRSRLVPRKEDAEDAFLRRITHAFRTAHCLLTRKHAMPKPL
ncbi:hypothetical protein VTO73DRAFT_1820 [Trametes versicolor]